MGIVSRIEERLANTSTTGENITDVEHLIEDAKGLIEKAKAEIHRALDRLQVESVDLIQLHNLTRPDDWISPWVMTGR